MVKDFQDIRVNVNIEKKDKDKVKISISLCHKITSMPLKDLRINLLRDDIELESYAIDTGKAVFDKVSFGVYRLLISRGEKELGAVKLEIV